MGILRSQQGVMGAAKSGWTRAPAGGTGLSILGASFFDGVNGSGPIISACSTNRTLRAFIAFFAMERREWEERTVRVVAPSPGVYECQVGRGQRRVSHRSYPQDVLSHPGNQLQSHTGPASREAMQ